MSGELIVHRNRTNRVPLGIGINVSCETITSQIRKEIDPTSTLLGTWDVEFATDGVDGELILTMASLEPAAAQENYGWMDLKRVSGSTVLPVFREPLRVKFQGVVTA